MKKYMKVVTVAGWFFLLTHQITVENKNLQNQETGSTTFVTDTKIGEFPTVDVCIKAEQVFQPSDTLRTGPFLVSPCIDNSTGDSESK